MRAERATSSVIGAGAAGAALTWRLASRGISGRLPRAGDWHRPSQFASERTNFEVQLRRGNLSFFPGRAAVGPKTTRSSPPVPGPPTW